MQTDRLDLDLLRAFVAVAQSQSFTRAGALLFRSQSAVSLQIRKLEQIVDERLFSRTARRVTLTPAGERLMGYAERMLALHDEALSAFRQGEARGHVRLGTPEDIATAHLPKALAEYSRAHPGIQLEVTCDLTLNLMDMFHAGRLDVALVKREPSAAVDGQRVWSEPLVWVGANDGVFGTDGVTALVVSPEPCVYRKRAVEALGRAGGRARAAYVCGSLAGALAAVRAGLGVAVLPRDFAPDDLAIDEGSRMPPLDDAEAVLLTAADAGLAARRLADHLAHALEDEPARF